MQDPLVGKRSLFHNGLLRKWELLSHSQKEPANLYTQTCAVVPGIGGIKAVLSFPHGLPSRFAHSQPAGVQEPPFYMWKVIESIFYERDFLSREEEAKTRRKLCKKTISVVNRVKVVDQPLIKLVWELRQK